MSCVDGTRPPRARDGVVDDLMLPLLELMSSEIQFDYRNMAWMSGRHQIVDNEGERSGMFTR